MDSATGSCVIPLYLSVKQVRCGYRSKTYLDAAAAESLQELEERQETLMQEKSNKS